MSKLTSQDSLASHQKNYEVVEDLLTQMAGAGSQDGASYGLGALIGSGVGMKMGGIKGSYQAWKGAEAGAKLKAAAKAGAIGSAKYGGIGAVVGVVGVAEERLFRKAMGLCKK